MQNTANKNKTITKLSEQVENLNSLKQDFIKEWSNTVGNNPNVLGYAAENIELKEVLLSILQSAEFIKDDIYDNELFPNGISRLPHELDWSDTLEKVLKDFNNVIEDIQEAIELFNEENTAYVDMDFKPSKNSFKTLSKEYHNKECEELKLGQAREKYSNKLGYSNYRAYLSAIENDYNTINGKVAKVINKPNNTKHVRIRAEKNYITELKDILSSSFCCNQVKHNVLEVRKNENSFFDKEDFYSINLLNAFDNKGIDTIYVLYNQNVIRALNEEQLIRHFETCRVEDIEHGSNSTDKEIVKSIELLNQELPLGVKTFADTITFWGIEGHYNYEDFFIIEKDQKRIAWFNSNEHYEGKMAALPDGLFEKLLVVESDESFNSGDFIFSQYCGNDIDEAYDLFYTNNIDKIEFEEVEEELKPIEEFDVSEFEKDFKELDRELKEKYPPVNRKMTYVDDLNNKVEFFLEVNRDGEEQIIDVAFSLKDSFTNRVFYYPEYNAFSFFVYPDIKTGTDDYYFIIEITGENLETKNNILKAIKHLSGKVWYTKEIEAEFFSLLDEVEKNFESIKQITKELTKKKRKTLLSA